MALDTKGTMSTDVVPFYANPELPALTPGTLYLVATPIGNLEDITLRALRTLAQCDWIAAEDTRHTSGLLHHYRIHKPLVSCFQFNEKRRSEEVLQALRTGAKVALVSDAGSPGISDPGERLVRAVLEAGLRVEAVPGPCALVAGLTASGLSTEEFYFVGFLPHKSGQRLKRLERLQNIEATLVLYESPYRVEKLLKELQALWPARQVVLARELTKRHEEYLRGSPSTLIQAWAARPRKGEFVVLVQGSSGGESTAPKPEAVSESEISQD